MTHHARPIARAMALIATLAATSAVAADLPKSGTYSAHYGWTFSGQVQELGPNRMAYVGMLPGVIFNNAGKGFLHQARVDCSILNDVNQGRGTASGGCVIIDAEGDKAFAEFKCSGMLPNCPGDFRWTGGTGKYTGITGNNKFQGNFIGTTGGGWSDWSGEYKLP